MATTLTTSERRRPITLRAAVRRLFALASRPSGEMPSSGVGFFNQAENVGIRRMNITVNQYGGIVADAVAPTVEQQSSEGTSTFESSPQGWHEPSPSPRRENPDVYVDCMLSEKHGYPLWAPSPDMSLPVLHQRLGVSLGDVGVLSLEGGFDFLFNIFHDASHPINAFFGVPEGFSHFEQPGGSAIRERLEWIAGTYKSNPRMTKVNTHNSGGQSHEEIVLQSKDSEAAVLMTPEDVYGVRLDITQALLGYIEDNIAAWYRFVKVTLGRTEIHNGDLRVIYSYRKSTGFGIATTFNTDQQTHTELKFSKDNTWTETYGCAYRWSYIGSAEAKAGPRRREISELGLAEPVMNQCLFIRTIDAKVSATIWEHIEEWAIGAPVNENLHSTLDKSPPWDSSALHSTNKKPDRKGTESASASTHQSHEHVFHPSGILYDILETMAPGLQVYIVCNDDWEPFIMDKDMEVINFVQQVFKNKYIVQHPGMAYFGNNMANIEKSLAIGAISITGTLSTHEPGSPWSAMATCVYLAKDRNREGQREREAKAKQVKKIEWDTDSDSDWDTEMPGILGGRLREETGKEKEKEKEEGMKRLLKSHEYVKPGKSHPLQQLTRETEARQVWETGWVRPIKRETSPEGVQRKARTEMVTMGERKREKDKGSESKKEKEEKRLPNISTFGTS